MLNFSTIPNKKHPKKPMAQPPKHNNSMYEETTQEIISPKNKNPTTRIARFLNPISNNSTLVPNISTTPFLHEVFTHKNIKKWPFEVNFNGYKKPLKNWGKWYYKLVANHATTWLKAGILDGIHSSLHKIPLNKEIILGICDFWCPKFNTFVFPWGEATVTLEDVLVLGGIPLLGGSLYKGIDGELSSIVDGLRRAKVEISNHKVWMEYFMSGDIDNELEHVAFLVLWLSRSVLPGLDANLISKIVFPVAAHLSKGTPICLAPIVLANLYQNLTLLVETANNNLELNSETVRLPALFQIVQLWVFERFTVFAENLAKPLHYGDPRIARWDNVEVKLKSRYIRSRIKSGEGFRWRPYADGLENWEILPFYEEKEQVLDDYMDFPCSDFASFGWFCHSCVIVGFRGKQQYNPHRVAMQFGYDQEIPGEFCELGFDGVGFIIPSRDFTYGMTKTYYKWWKESIKSHKEAVRNAFKVLDLEPIIENSLEKACSSLEEGEIRKIPEISFKVLDLEPIIENSLEKACSSLEEGEIREFPAISPKTPEICTTVVMFPDDSDENMDVSGDSDNVPLAIRLRTKMTTTLGENDSESDSHDIDHVPLALRLETIVGRKRNSKPCKTHATSDAVSRITRKRTSLFQKPVDNNNNRRKAGNTRSSSNEA